MSETLFLRRPGAGCAQQVRVVRRRRRWLAGAARRMAGLGLPRWRIRAVLGLSETRLAALLASSSIWGEWASALAAEMRRAA